MPDFIKYALMNRYNQSNIQYYTKLNFNLDFNDIIQLKNIISFDISSNSVID